MYETPLIKGFTGAVLVIEPEDSKAPKVLRIEGSTETGPLVLLVSEIAAVELAAILNKHPLIRGSA